MPALLETQTRDEWLRAMGYSAALIGARELWHSLQVLGALNRLRREPNQPNGGREHKFWGDWVRTNPRVVKRALLDVREFRLREGIWPKNVGAYMNDFLRKARR